MNYHNKQQNIEKRYKKKLDLIFESLFIELSKIYPLTESTINHIINTWLWMHEAELLKVTQENVDDLSIIADSMITQYVQDDLLEHKLIQANMNLIMQELDKIKQQYNILTTQSSTYGIPTEVRKEREQQIQSSSINSLELLAINQSILNTREIMFHTAANQGFSAYLAKTQEDERVRQSHWEHYQDKWIKFDNPPSIGHIGTQINCRCFAVEFK